MFLAHPIVGIGVGTFDEVAYQMPGNTLNPDFHLHGWHAHNVPLHVLTEAGVLGLAAWVFLWYRRRAGAGARLEKRGRRTAPVQQRRAGVGVRVSGPVDDRGADRRSRRRRACR